MQAFSKKNKLLKRSDYAKCYTTGKRYFTANFIVFVLPTSAETWRYGLAVSRKVGGAVQRNRIKRLLREFFRLHQHLFTSGADITADIAVVAKQGRHPERLSYPSLEKELLSLLTGLFDRTGKQCINAGPKAANCSTL
jgi:ribonuclease P protein component